MSSHPPTPPPGEDTEDSTEALDLFEVVDAFLGVFPEPTDEQLHKFAELLGIPYEEFEEQVFEMFSDIVDEEDVDDLVEDEDVIRDDLDMFILSFFLYVDSPSEDQIHGMAEMIGITPEEFEERVYRMLSELTGDDSETD